MPKKETVPTASAKKSIAVLPFEDLSQAKNSEYLCDGISETLINALTNIEGLWIPARTSAFFFRGKTQDIHEIGQKLAVDNVLEGSVQVAGNNLRVTALKIKLLGEKGALLIKNYTENLEAYSLYLQGRNFWNKRGEANLIKSIGYFEKAIEVDPNHAATHQFLGWVYEALEKNEEALKCYLRVIELNEGSEDRDSDIAGCYALMGKREEARKILRNLIEYSKGNYVSPVSIDEVFAALGEKDPTFVWLERAYQERDPNLIQSPITSYRFDSVRSDPRYADLIRRIGFEK